VASEGGPRVDLDRGPPCGYGGQSSGSEGKVARAVGSEYTGVDARPWVDGVWIWCVTRTRHLRGPRSGGDVDFELIEVIYEVIIFIYYVPIIVYEISICTEEEGVPIFIYVNGDRVVGSLLRPPRPILSDDCTAIALTLPLALSLALGSGRYC